MIGRKTAIAIIGSLALSFGFGFVHPWGELHATSRSGTILAGTAAPPEVRAILAAKCADCHSDSTNWPLYARFAPASWLLEHDVRAGRSAIDFSTWSAMRTEEQVSALTRVAAELRSGEMPPRAYTLVHPHNRLTPQEQQIVIDWARLERKRIRAAKDQPQGTEKK